MPTPAGIFHAAWGYNKAGKVVEELRAPNRVNSMTPPLFLRTCETNGESGLEVKVFVVGGSGSAMFAQE